MLKSGPVGLVGVAKGVPVSAEQREQRIWRPQEGDAQSEELESTVWRSSAGKIRIEFLVRKEKLNPDKLVYLLDADSYSYVLSVGAKTAHRTNDVEGSPPGLPWIGFALPEGKWSIETQELGTKISQSLTLVGRRIIRALDIKPTVSMIEESWFSEDLNLFYEASVSGPSWSHNARLNIISRAEPDSSLFVLPPDVVIEQ